MREDLEPEDLVQVIALYLDNLPTKVTRIRAAFESRNGQALARAAHALKGACRQLGILSLADWCEQLERAGRTEELGPAEDWLRLLEQAIPVVQAAVQRVMTTE